MARIRRWLAFVLSLCLLLALTAAFAPAGLARHGTGTTVNGIDVDSTTIPELQELMDEGELSSFDLVQFYVHRIKNLNSMLNAVIAISPTAISDANAADRARAHGDDRPLLGIPIIVKDNIDTTGMPTTAGSWALNTSRPTDAFVIQQLRDAGALIIGKANLSEWANWRSNPSSSGWSGIGGQTNMPYVLDRNPCGSSSGSGVAAAADLAVAAVGSETDGSIVCPSGANGVVGIKPTLGLISRAGIVPITADQDTSGPIARNVTDAAVLLGAMTGIDSHDPATGAQAGHAYTDYTPFLDEDALDGARIGVWRDGTFDPSASPWVDDFIDGVVAELEAAGATVVEGMDILPNGAATGDIYNAEFSALLCESKDDMTTYMQTYAPKFPKGFSNDLQGLLDFNNANPQKEGPWNSDLWEAALDTGGRDAECADFRADATPPTQDLINDLMADNNLDAIIAPTNGPAWVTSDDPDRGDLEGTDDFAKFVGSSAAAAISGYADITVPAGAFDDTPLPLGITFIGGRWDEPTLIGLAFSYEQATQHRQPPEFVTTIGANP